jgi:REP element-mobilizing transposase RayT
MNFNLSPPPDFHGFDPNKRLRVYTRNLPHWRQAGATYFVTFNLADALPTAKRNELASMRRVWENRYPPPRDESTWTEYAKVMFQKVEKWLDIGFGKCWFQYDGYAGELRRTILHFHEVRYEVGCFVIMPNHCHLVIRPFETFELEEEVGAMKNITAIFVNKEEGRQGQLWHQESYDRIIRDAEHLYRVIQYIGANPRRAGIPHEKWLRWINPDWQLRGWDFHDAQRS